MTPLLSADSLTLMVEFKLYSITPVALLCVSHLDLLFGAISPAHKLTVSGGDVGLGGTCLVLVLLDSYSFRRLEFTANDMLFSLAQSF